VQAYFEDMRTVLRQLLDLAEPKAQLWFVVATSAYAGIEVPVDFICAEIASDIGWSVREIGVLRDLRSSGQHWNRLNGNTERRVALRESVIVLSR
jgi:hypothetical protein